jgi:multidrug efflux system outer membrane protein
MPSDSVKDESEYWTVRGSLDMQLKITPSLSIEEELRQLRAELLDLKIAGRISSLKYDLTVLYYGILSAEKRITLQQENLQLAENRLLKTELQYEQGLKSDLELLSAKIAAARDVPGLQKESTAQEKRYITLRNYLGLDESLEIRLMPAPLKETLLPEKESVLHSVPLNLDLLSLEKQIRQAELNYRKAKKETNGPTLGMSLGLSSSVNPAFEGDSWSSEEWRDSLGLGLSLSIPLDGHIKGSSDQLNLKDLEETIEAARINLDEAGRSLKDEIRSLYLDIELSRSNIEVDELNVSLLEQNNNKMEQSYNSGRVSLMDLDDSRQELKEAVLTLEDEKLNLTTLKVELLHLLNLN